MREPSATLYQSYYGSQLVYAVGYFFFSIAKRVVRRRQKKIGKLEFDMPTNTNTNTSL